MARTHTTSIFSNHSVDDEGLEPFIQKKERVKNEMSECGVTNWGLRKFNSRYLPKIIHDFEHLNGVIYGRFSEGPGLLEMTDRMVVATDRRVISLNHKPGYTDIDEFTYDIIDGITESTAGFFASVMLSTKMGTFTVRYVRKNCSRRFVHYIEKRRLEYFDMKSRKL